MIAEMFERNGWEVVSDIREADLLQFTGGADVSPGLYGHVNIASQTNYVRDNLEQSIFKQYGDKKMAGICRGGQFLNVMCGGTMYQDQDGHPYGAHVMHVSVDDYGPYTVTSTHHQVMRAGPNGEVIGWAKYPAYLVSDDGTGNARRKLHDITTEVVLYPGRLCFQPHPEYKPDSEMERLYFRLINTKLF